MALAADLVQPRVGPSVGGCFTSSGASKSPVGQTALAVEGHTQPYAGHAA